MGPARGDLREDGVVAARFEVKREHVALCGGADGLKIATA